MNGFTTEYFIKRASDVHKGKYKYNEVVYKNNYTKVCITCPKHGIFWQTPAKHLQGQGCPKCGRELSNSKQTRVQEEYIQQCNEVHNYKYIYNETIYINAKSKVCITCPKHGDFWQIADNHLCGHGCPMCGNIMSHKENEIYDFCKLIDNETELRNREILNNKEIDIYCPSVKVGIEFNGLYWHSEHFKEDPINCHLNKSNLAKKKGIRLIHIFEDEWIEQTDIVKSFLNKILCSKDIITINAEECSIKEVQYKEATDFLKLNDLQGECKTKYYFGLYFKDYLVSLIVIGYSSKNDTYKILRLCEMLNISVVDGFSKLLSYIIQLLKPSKIVAYADKRYCEEEIYKTLGFSYVETLPPDYYYVIDRHREDKLKYTKRKLVEQGFDKDKAEHQIMKERGFYRIYDCGKDIYELSIIY